MRETGEGPSTASSRSTLSAMQQAAAATRSLWLSVTLQLRREKQQQIKWRIAECNKRRHSICVLREIRAPPQKQRGPPAGAPSGSGRGSTCSSNSSSNNNSYSVRRQREGTETDEWRERGQEGRDREMMKRQKAAAATAGVSTTETVRR